MAGHAYAHIGHAAPLFSPAHKRRGCPANSKQLRVMRCFCMDFTLDQISRDIIITDPSLSAFIPPAHGRCSLPDRCHQSYRSQFSYRVDIFRLPRSGAYCRSHRCSPSSRPPVSIGPFTSSFLTVDRPALPLSSLSSGAVTVFDRSPKNLQMTFWVWYRYGCGHSWLYVRTYT